VACFVLLCFIATHVSATEETPARIGSKRNESWSYGRLGFEVASAQWQQMMSLWSTFNESTSPSDAWWLRGAVVEVREQIDIFCYAYPIVYARHEKKETFHLLFDDLTSGYQALGDYSDLRKVNYTEKDRQERNKIVMQWKADFLKHGQELHYEPFVLGVSEHKLHERPKHDLSYQYWGSTSTIPSLKLTGFQNIALLGKGQWKSLYEKKDKIFNLTSIWLPKEHSEFHDYRKLLGYAIALIDPQFEDLGFPEILQANVSSQVDIGNDLDHRQGILNDLIVGYYFYEQHGDKVSAQRNLDQIKVLWPQLQQWVNVGNWSSVIQSVIASFIKT